MEKHLEEKIGVTYRWISRETEYTGGVGGKCKIIGVVEIPLVTAGASGIKSMKVTEANIPPLIYGGCCKAMGAVIDYDDHIATWKRLQGRKSDLTLLPSVYLTCRVDRCERGTWVDPRPVSEETKKQQVRDPTRTYTVVTENDFSQALNKHLES